MLDKLLIKNAQWIISLDDEGNRYQNADLLIEGNVIKAIGKNLEVEYDTQVIDATGKVVIPGMVNTHHHFYQTLTRAIPSTQEIELFDWLTQLYEIWRELDEESVYFGSLVAMGELLKTGCTTSTDHHYVFPRGKSTELIDVQIKAAKELGMRFHPTRGSMSLSKKDGGLPPDDVVQTEEEILEDSERLIKLYHDPNPYAMCRIALAPCSPFSVTGRLMEETVVLARKYGVICHTHLAETKDEENFCLEKFGMRPFEYMKSLGWSGEDIWFAHSIHLTDDEIKEIGETRSGVAHCPVSNLKLSSGIARIKDLVDAGARVGLAVDGSASNDSSNMWAELKTAYLLQKYTLGQKGLSAEETLRMACRGGAEVLGRTDIGYLAPGMAADMVLIDFTDIAFAGAQHDPVAAIVTCGDSQVVDTTIVNGKVVVRDGKLLAFNEDFIATNANRVSARMVAAAAKRTGIDYLKSN
ncbi:MAG: 8-oxoguanine deaminase [Clostridia bacterium]|jgi:8-oxoguanine deaminase|nr:8-oxoguanine deaminase [Clostridia bacterium]